MLKTVFILTMVCCILIYYSEIFFSFIGIIALMRENISRCRLKEEMSANTIKQELWKMDCNWLGLSTGLSSYLNSAMKRDTATSWIFSDTVFPYLMKWLKSLTENTCFWKITLFQKRFELMSQMCSTFLVQFEPDPIMWSRILQLYFKSCLHLETTLWFVYQSLIMSFLTLTKSWPRSCSLWMNAIANLKLKG